MSTLDRTASELAAERRAEGSPDFGPDWWAAIEFGIDVSLLIENLLLTPAQRLERLQQLVDFHEHLRDARPVR